MNKELNQPSIVDDVSFSVCVKDNEHSHFMDIEIVWYCTKCGSMAEYKAKWPLTLKQEAF